MTVLPSNGSEEIELGRENDGALVVDLECRPPLSRRSADVLIEIFERWRALFPVHPLLLPLSDQLYEANPAGPLKVFPLDPHDGSGVGGARTQLGQLAVIVCVQVA